LACREKTKTKTKKEEKWSWVSYLAEVQVKVVKLFSTCAVLTCYGALNVIYEKVSLG